MRISTDAVSLGYGHTTVVDQVSLAVPEGATTVIVGGNGCGKSTLLRGLARLLKPAAGACLLDGHAVHRLPTREVARVLGLLPQQPHCPEGITVVDLVARGRQPHRAALARWSSTDDAAVTAALEMTGTLALADRPVDELSGGQRQRVWVALALAQQPEVLLLDEPTTFLDVAHQIELLDLLYELRLERGTTVVMVLHDLNLAARYADHLVAMRDGRVVASGTPADVVTPELVREVFGLDAQVVVDPVAATPMVVPIGRHHRAALTPISSAKVS
jgi:iron complex transport system ATP-binding protein